MIVVLSICWFIAIWFLLTFMNDEDEKWEDKNETRPAN